VRKGIRIKASLPFLCLQKSLRDKARSGGVDELLSATVRALLGDLDPREGRLKPPKAPLRLSSCLR
jgi:hypothetical protein